jgi:septal ring factor EnvC (AmiA/AmiB activator)
MWRIRFSLLLSLLLVFCLVPSYSSDEKIIIYQSELTELITLLDNLELNQKQLEKQLAQQLESANLLSMELLKASTQLSEWERTYKELENSWTEYKNETNKEMQHLKRNNRLLLLGLGVSIVLGAVVF